MSAALTAFRGPVPRGVPVPVLPLWDSFWMLHLGPGVLPGILLGIQAWGCWASKLPQGTAAWCWSGCSPALLSLAPHLASVTLLVTHWLPLRLVRRVSAMRKHLREAGGDSGPEPQPWGQTSQWGCRSLPSCMTSDVTAPL